MRKGIGCRGGTKRFPTWLSLLCARSEVCQYLRCVPVETKWASTRIHKNCPTEKIITGIFTLDLFFKDCTIFFCLVKDGNCLQQLIWSDILKLGSVNESAKKRLQMFSSSEASCHENLHG